MENREKYQISTSMKDGVLEIVVKGEVSDSTYGSVVNEGNAIIKANKATKIIADFRAIDKRLDPSEMYRYFRTYDSLLFNVQYAIVDLPENIHYKNSAVMAGLKTLMWFTDMDEARAWFKERDQILD